MSSEKENYILSEIRAWGEWLRRTILVCGVLFMFCFALTQAGYGFLPVLPTLVARTK